MKSPNQWRPSSTPKPVKLTAGSKIMQPMADSRKTPTTKTAAKLYNNGYGGSQ